MTTRTEETMKKEPVKRYSQSFKQQVIREYEAGASITSLRQKYGIGSHRTVERWVKKYSRSGYRSEKVVIQTVADQLEVKAMKARIAELERALADAVIDNRMLTTTLEVASERLEMDLKKNFGRRLS
ncbi:MAG TPA: transposase [Candidatus Saccharimonadales bacterium]